MSCGEHTLLHLPHTNFVIPSGSCPRKEKINNECNKAVSLMRAAWLWFGVYKVSGSLHCFLSKTMSDIKKFFLECIPKWISFKKIRFTYKMFKRPQFSVSFSYRNYRRQLNQLCLASSIRSSSWLLIPHYQSLICGTTGERLNERTLNFIVVSKWKHLYL